MDVLMDPDLLNIIVKKVQNLGVVGEEQTIKAITLVCCGKLVKNKETISTNLHPEDTTGVGKDWVVENTMKVVFPDDWIKFNAPSPTSISYSQRQENVGTPQQPRYQIVGTRITKHKIIYIKDAKEEFMNGDDCKVLLEERSVDLPKTINQRTVRLRWSKPVVIMTTADTTTGNQIKRRLPSLSLDSTYEQTQAIMYNQLKRDCEKPDYALIKESHDFGENFKRLKSPIYVNLKKIKSKIEENRPKCNEVIMRSLYPRLLDYIKFSCALHQKQREQVPGQSVYFANEQDLKYGLELFKAIYSYDLVDVSLLNKRQKKLHKKFHSLKNKNFTASQIMAWKEADGVSKPTLLKDLMELMRVDKHMMCLEDSVNTYMYGDI